MIFRRDGRPVFQQVISGLKISAIIIASGYALLICLSFIPVYRIEAFFWHLRYGTSVEVGGYRFPAPKQWYVKRLSADDVLLTDLQTGDTIDVKEIRRTEHPITLAAWAELTSRPTRDVKVTGRRELQIGNEHVICLEEDFDLKKFHLHPISCRSEGTLELSFTPFPSSTENRNEAFYSLLQQTVIRR